LKGKQVKSEHPNDVFINWTSEESIKRAERKKQRLENLGLVPIKTVSWSDGAVITYAKPKTV